MCSDYIDDLEEIDVDESCVAEISILDLDDEDYITLISNAIAYLEANNEGDFIIPQDQIEEVCEVN